MYYYKVHCSYNGTHKTIFFRSSKKIGEIVPIRLKLLVGIYKVDSLEECSREDWEREQLENI